VKNRDIGLSQRMPSQSLAVAPSEGLCHDETDFEGFL